MDFLSHWLSETWGLLAESSIYVLFGILIGGLLKVFLSPSKVARHLGRGRFASVIKAALLGIPMPLCSCGVLPAGASLRRQGANRGATASFLISTPETGVDSMAITYALLGPVMTVARPVAAFVTAAVAGITENLLGRPEDREIAPDLSCPVDGCCDGIGCDEATHRRHHGFGEKLWAGLRYAFGDLWGDLAGWFMVGMLLAGLIGALVPPVVMERYLGGGWQSMLLMLAVGIPLYICATASTPIAAMLIRMGGSPGAALVFLLAGPATNMASLSVLLGVLGKRATAIYLVSIAVMSVLAGLALDALYGWMGWSAAAVAGEAAELIPGWLQVAGALVLLALSIKPIWRRLKARLSRRGRGRDEGGGQAASADSGAEGAEPVTSCSGST